MSRGLGKLQREILAAAGNWRETMRGECWPGGEIVSASGNVYCVSRGVEFNPPADLIDMRAISHLMGKRWPIHRRHVFQASFARAVVGLERRGHIEAAHSATKYRRFYRLAKRYDNCHNAYNQPHTTGGHFGHQHDAGSRAVD